MDRHVLRLTTTKQEILGIFKARQGEAFFVNELVRLTGRFPNSVEQAVRTLEKDGVIHTYKDGHKRFFSLNSEYAAEVAEAIPDGKKFEWIKLLNREVSYAFNPVLCNSNITNLHDVYGIRVPTFWYNDLTRGVYYLKDEMATVGKAISERLAKDSDFARRDIKACRESCNTLVSYSRKLSYLRLSGYSNDQLGNLVGEFSKIYQAVFPFMVTPHAVERYFEGKIREEVTDKQVLEVLLSPVSTEDEERDSALKVAAYTKEHGRDKGFEEMLTSHWQAFRWLSVWSVNVQPLSRDYFLEEIDNILGKVHDPKAEIERLEIEEKKRRAALENVLKRIMASSTLRDQVAFLQEYIVLRTYRKNAICQGNFYHLPLLSEVAFRLKLSEVGVKLLAYDELERGLRGEQSIKQLELLIRERSKGWAILMWQGRISIITGGRKIIQAMEQYRITLPGRVLTNIIMGNTASRGKVVGKVKVIHKISELDKVKPGDILVAKMTTPDYMTAINRCVGIITDEGGVTCHAAIVSREFNIPCLIATHNATSLLNDNDIVELDATKGLARVIEAINMDTSVKEVKGKPVYGGKVRGKVVVVNTVSDLEKVRLGDILITSQPTPDYLSSLYRVGGMVIDEDSITSHGVLYARSLRIPTIMGTGNAREFLTDGEVVELDSKKGMVRRLTN